MVQLSAAQLKRFKTDGFLVLRASEHRLVDPADLQQWTTEVKSLPREKDKWMPYDEITAIGEHQLMRTENFADYHAHFGQLLYGEPLRNILAQLTGDEMLLFKDKINYKIPGGNGFQAHLDAPAYDHIGRIEHTTANIAVDAATVENGCIEVVPGSHLMDVELSNGGRITQALQEIHEWTKVEMAPGDLLIFGSHLAHRSGENKTKRQRSSIYATYHCAKDGRDSNQRYYADRRENFPPDHERMPGKDYEAGVQRYAFAAPFTMVDKIPNQAQRA